MSYPEHGVPVLNRTMTDADHRQIGTALGFPSCCVEAWIASRPFEPPMAARNGRVHLGIREMRPDGLPDWWSKDAYGDDTLAGASIVYVPCDSCAGPHTPGWRAPRG